MKTYPEIEAGYIWFENSVWWRRCPLCYKPTAVSNKHGCIAAYKRKDVCLACRPAIYPKNYKKKKSKPVVPPQPLIEEDYTLVEKYGQFLYSIPFKRRIVICNHCSNKKLQTVPAEFTEFSYKCAVCEAMTYTKI